MSLPPPYDLGTLASRLGRGPRNAASAEPNARASVAAILRDPGAGQDAELLFIRRAERDSDPWSGHMAFPGGRREEADASLLATAIRETREEVGIDLEAHGRLLTELGELHAIARGRRTGLIITPFVFALDRDVELTFDPDEVAEALWVPFGPLARRDDAGTIKHVVEGYEVELPCLHIRGRVLWGLTHRMLEMMLTAMTPVT